MMHLMKLLVALALAAAPSARGMAPYATDSELEERVQELEERVQELEEELAQCQAAIVTCGPTAAPTTAEPTAAPELNGCGEPCAGVVTISSTSFLIESDVCYVVNGMFPSGVIKIPDGVDCAKITVPSGSGLFGIDAHLPRPSSVASPAKH